MLETDEVSTELGFLEEQEAWKLESYKFPSKVGGKPAWLSLKNLPKPEEDLKCKKCEKPLIFLCQVYASSEDDHSFHRTIFIFICRNSNCCEPNNSNNIKAFRSTLPRDNEFYSYEAPNEDMKDKNFSISKWVNLCQVCGSFSTKRCCKCNKTWYCSKHHQVIDWKEGHKNQCKSDGRIIFSTLFPEFEVIIEEEDKEGEKVEIKSNVELSKFKQLEVEGNTGSMTATPGAELEALATGDYDKTFTKFQEAIKKDPDQILRYKRGGEPLWIAEGPKPEEIPLCEYCGSPRQYEFQIMPQLLFYLKENELDWGTIIVYTCSNTCPAQDCYKNEFVFKQDVAIKNP